MRNLAALPRSSRLARSMAGLRLAALCAVGLSIGVGVRGVPIAAAAELDATSRAETIDGVLDLLARSYVFPEVAKEMAAAIRARQEAGEYEQIANGAAVATILTEHLREVCHDLHLRVRYSPEPLFDLRQNGGGDPDMVAHISSYLFGDKPVHLNSLYFRPADKTTEFWTDPDGRRCATRTARWPTSSWRKKTRSGRRGSQGPRPSIRSRSTTCTRPAAPAGHRPPAPDRAARRDRDRRLTDVAGRVLTEILA